MSFNSIVECRPKHKSIRNTYKRIKSRLGLGSCISRDDANTPNKQFDPEVCYSKRSTTTSPASYSQHVVIENISIDEFHNDAEISDEKEDESSQITGNDGAPNITEERETFCVEIDRLSLANRKLSDQLQSVRHQLSDNLNRVRDFEERVKLIPKLQLELSVEKAENRDMHIKVKALENALKSRERNEKITNELPKATEPSSPTVCEIPKTKSFNAQRVCAMSLESLNVRFANTSSPVQTTHNVGCMTTKLLSRDIGIVTTTPMVVQTKSVAVNTSISGRNPFEDMIIRPKVQNISTQSECEPKIQTRNIATITDSVSVHKIEKRSIVVQVTPNVTENSSMARPETRSIGVDNIYQKSKMRTIGIDPIKDLIENTSMKQNNLPISLKLLDNIQVNPIPLLESEVKPKPKEFLSIGVQHSPNQSDKFSQCKEHVAEPSPKIQSRTESTDTGDLMLFIHRGVNTEASRPKKSRFTNTDPCLTDEKSTNTLNNLKNVKNSGTNTDPHETTLPKIIDEKRSDLAPLSEHKCHNCLAKIEIKQRTIIKNPNKSHNLANIATSSADHTYSEDLVQQSDLQTRIPRPTALISPRSEKTFTRQNTYTIQSAPPSQSSTSVESASACPAEMYLAQQTCPSNTRGFTENESHTETHIDTDHRIIYQNRNDEEISEIISTGNNANTPEDNSREATESTDTGSSSKQMTFSENEERKLWSHSMKSSSTYLQLASRPRQKVKPSKEMQAALKVINDSITKNDSQLRGEHLETTLKNANKIVQKEWFRISSTENAQPGRVEDYLDNFEEFSPDLLKYIVNSTDANGNTAMHYSVSHGNFDIVSILLDSKMCNINNTNNAGYTCVMLVSLAKLEVAEHQMVVQRLFQMSDVNVRAKKHSQTALMLATSHGNYNMVRMLLDAGADINIQDEDGSTALMCAAEHGRMDIIKILLAQPDCDSTIQDLDGSTALKISLEAGYRDIGVLLYAHEYMLKNKSPYTSLRSIGRLNQKPSSSPYTSSNTIQGHASNSNITNNADKPDSMSTSIDKNKR